MSARWSGKVVLRFRAARRDILGNTITPGALVGVLVERPHAPAPPVKSDTRNEVQPALARFVGEIAKTAARAWISESRRRVRE